MSTMQLHAVNRTTRLLQVGVRWNNPEDDARGHSTVMNSEFFDIVIPAGQDFNFVSRPNRNKRTGLRDDGRPYQDPDEYVYVEVTNEFFNQVMALQAAKKAEAAAQGVLTEAEATALEA